MQNRTRKHLNLWRSFSLPPKKLCIANKTSLHWSSQHSKEAAQEVMHAGPEGKYLRPPQKCKILHHMYKCRYCVTGCVTNFCSPTRRHTHTLLFYPVIPLPELVWSFSIPVWWHQRASLLRTSEYRPTNVSLGIECSFPTIPPRSLFPARGAILHFLTGDQSLTPLLPFPPDPGPCFWSPGCSPAVI